VHEQFLEIPTAAGRMETFVTHPEQDAPFAPVILYMDVWGVREVLYDLARRIATVGYYVMVPDLYYRSSWLGIRRPVTRGADAGMKSRRPGSTYIR
jgi:dienelactone hydrolase